MILCRFCGDVADSGGDDAVDLGDSDAGLGDRGDAAAGPATERAGLSLLKMLPPSSGCVANLRRPCFPAAGGSMAAHTSDLMAKASAKGGKPAGRGERAQRGGHGKTKGAGGGRKARPKSDPQLLDKAMEEYWAKSEDPKLKVRAAYCGIPWGEYCATARGS